jgi:O-antigen ligase
VLCQSRGMALALLVTTALVLAAVPGRARRAWALLVIGASVAIAAPALLDIYDEVGGAARLPAEDTVRHAAAGVVLAAVLAGGVWGTATGMAGSLAARGASATARLRTASIAGLAIVAFAALVIGAARADSLADRAGDQYDSFVKLGEDRRVGDARFLSGGGNRYDYWRIALREFRDEPLRGVGAGNYDVGYFRERRTTEDVHQPHSLALQVLAELGLVGGGLLALFAGAVLAGLIGLVRRARDEVWARAMAVAAGGGFVAWLVQTEVDWLQLLPAITGVALAAAAVALRPWEVPESRRPASPWLRAAALCALAAALAIVAVGVARPVRADRLVAEGQDRLREDPAQALAKADDALKLNPDSMAAYYLKASAYARGDDYLLARATLLEAVGREPEDWVTWALLGDLASRRGDRRLALRYYRRGLALNPRDPELARLIGRAR